MGCFKTRDTRPRSLVGRSTEEAERGEVLASIREALCETSPRRPTLEACADLLSHLAKRTAARYDSCRSSSSRRLESRGATSVRPPKRQAL